MTKDSKKDNQRDTPEWHFEPRLLRKYLAQVKFTLPVYVPLPDGKYHVRIDGRKADIDLKRVKKKTPFSSIIKADDDVVVFTPHLRFDPFNATSVVVTFKPTAEELRLLEDPDKQKRDPYTEGTIDPGLQASLMFLNKMLRVYQFLTNNTALGRIQPWDVGIFDLRVGPYPKSPPGSGVTYKHFGFSRPTTFTKAPVVEEEFVDEIRNKIGSNWDVTQHDQLLLTARYLYLAGDFAAAIITAQSALESYLSTSLSKHIEHIKVKRRKKTLSVPVDRAGLALMCKEGLEQAVRNRLSDISSPLSREVNEARLKRNRIIHDGESASMEEADSGISAFQNAIDVLRPIL